MKKKLLALALTVAIACSSSMVASATKKKKKASPASGDIIETVKTPIGNLTAVERAILSAKECDSCPVPYHFSALPHSHEITAITNRYRGQIDRGVVVETTARVNATTTLSYSRGRTISNSYNVSIAFDDDVISSTLGYNVTFESSALASYAIEVPPNKMASISLQDMYDVTEFNVKTTYVYNTIPIRYSYEYGDGWAQQWTNFGFSSRVW